ncbi:MAG: glycoside hydrolase family 76 protein [Eisenbergiella massiliensis]
MRKIIYSVLHVTAAVFCIFLAAAAVCGCSGMNGAAGNMTGKEEKRLNEEMAEKMERRLPEEVKREQIGKDTAITAMDRFLAKFYVMSDDGTGAIVGEQFWPRAEIMEIAVDAWEKTSSPQYRDLMEQMYLGFVKDFGEDWSDNEYNDDIIWMTIACARACQAEENEVYKEQAVRHFNLVCDRAWSEDLGGGLFWRTDNKTKNSCINGPAAIAACILYQITGEQEYLEKAVRIYDWQCENLVGEDGAVYDAYDLENGINKWCSTYNQGTFIGAGLCLYRITGKKSIWKIR